VSRRRGVVHAVRDYAVGTSFGNSALDRIAVSFTLIGKRLTHTDGMVSG